MAQIAIGGFQHEANTFAPAKADFEAFARGDMWPALSRCSRRSLGSTFRSRASSRKRAAWATACRPCRGRATPSAQVTGDAFERITGRILADLREAERSWIASICSFESSTGSRSKIHLIPPVQGGVVVEPV